MSTGTQIALGVGLALVVFLVIMAWRKRPAPPTAPMTGDLDTRLRTLVAEGKQILAIKELRAHRGTGLKEAKDYVDALDATGEPPPLPVARVSEETLALARSLVAQRKIVLAVKAIRDETGWDLKRCKDIVDAMPRGKWKDDGFGYHV
jgi:ribosomal protein L7/L12